MQSSEPKRSSLDCIGKQRKPNNMNNPTRTIPDEAIDFAAAAREQRPPCNIQEEIADAAATILVKAANALRDKSQPMDLRCAMSLRLMAACIEVLILDNPADIDPRSAA